MTASQQRVQWGVKPGDVSLVSISASPGVEGMVVRDPVITDDFARRRADSLDAEAAYYRHRAIQEEQALGPGYGIVRLLAVEGGWTSWPRKRDSVPAVRRR